MLYPSGPSWTPEEDRVLKEHYGKIRIKDILKLHHFNGRSESALSMRAKKLGIKSGLKKTLYKDIKIDFFKNPTIESAYWSGFLCADGTLVKNPNKNNTYTLGLRISIKDEEHLKLFQKAMGHTGKIGHIENVGGIIDGRQISGGPMCFLNICQAGRFLDDLAKMGIIPNKTKRIPPPCLESDVLKLAFYKGLIDGDGTMPITYGTRFYIGLISSCESILEWSKELMDRLFPFSYMDREFSKVNSAPSGAFTYNISGHKAFRIVSILSKIPTPCLARKWQQPRLLEMIEESKVSHPEIWATPLPIEHEIEEFLKNNVSPSPSTTSVNPS